MTSFPSPSLPTGLQSPVEVGDNFDCGIPTPGEYQQLFEGLGGWIFSVVFSPDGSTLATGNGDKTVRLWNVHTGEHQQTLEGHTGSVFSVAFSPDGDILASGSTDKTVRLWNVHTGEYQQTLEGHKNSVSSLAFSPDGGTLASGSVDNTIRLWNVHTGEHQQTLEGHTGWVWSVAFSQMGVHSLVGVGIRPFGCGMPAPENTGSPLKGIYGRSGRWRTPQMGAP